MTVFNPGNKLNPTIGELLKPAMNIVKQEDADQYLKSYIEFTQHDGSSFLSNKEVEQICKSNIGYFAGYYSDEVRERVERLFNCSHPIFGSIKENGTITPEKAFQAGLRLKSFSCNLDFTDKVKEKIDTRNEVNTNISVLDQKIMEQRKQNELAELQTQENLIISRGITPQLLQQKVIDKWDGHLSTYNGNPAFTIPLK